MRKLRFLFFFLLFFGVSNAQEKLSKEEQARREKNIQAGNPFAKFGYKAKVATLSKGKYLEFHDLDSIVTIGTMRWHVEKEQIVAQIVQDTLNPDAQPIGDRAGRWMSPDPLSEEFPDYSPYTFVNNNPLRYNDPTGMAAEDVTPPSTHLDQNGQVVAVFNDGDNGVYQHGKNADGGSVTEYQLSKRAENQGTSSGGIKVGETAHWDEFVNPETNKTMTETTVQIGKSFDPIIKSMNEKAQGMDLKEIASKSGPGGIFDIKVPFANSGGLLNGKYTTSRSAGNFLAGYNAQGSTYFGVGISFTTFQKLAGGLHANGGLSNSEKAGIVLKGTTYGPPPAYGEIMYQYRMSKAGWQASEKK